MKILFLFVCLVITDYVWSMEVHELKKLLEKEHDYDMNNFGFHIFALNQQRSSKRLRKKTIKIDEPIEKLKQKNKLIQCSHCPTQFTNYSRVSHTCRAYLIHQYQAHADKCEHKNAYNNLRKYIESNYTKSNNQYHIVCPACSEKINVTCNLSLLLRTLFQHLYGTMMHNASEVEKITNYINEQSTK